MSLESTLAQLKLEVENAIAEYGESGISPPMHLVEILDRLSSTGAATEVTLAAVRDRLPSTGTATEVTLNTVNAKIPNLTDGRLPTDVVGIVAVSNLPTTQPISASDLPLPTGAATEVTLAAVRDRLPLTGAATETTLVQLRDRLPSTGAATETTLSALNTKIPGLISNRLPTDVVGSVAVSNFPATQPISASNLPLPTGAATEATLVQLRDRSLGPTDADNAPISKNPLLISGKAITPATYSPGYSDTDAATLAIDKVTGRLLTYGRKLTAEDDIVTVGGTARTTNLRQRWRDDFAGTSLDPAAWTVVQTGSGHSISVVNSELRIATGMTASTETIIRSVRSYRIPFRMYAITMLSQRIANQEFYLEVIDASGLHSASWLFDGTNNFAAKTSTANNGMTLGNSTVAAVNSGVYTNLEIELSAEEVNFYNRTTDSNSVRGGVAKNRQIPDYNLEYFIQIRARNLQIAPVSSTSFNFDLVFCEDIEEFAAKIIGGRAGGSPNQGVPITGIVTTTIPAASLVISTDSQTTNLESNIALGANISIICSARDTAKNNINTHGHNNTVRGWVLTDQSGTLMIDHSRDNSTWRQTHSFPISGNISQATPYEFKLLARYYRIRYVNGATAQTSLEIISTMFNIGA